MLAVMRIVPKSSGPYPRHSLTLHTVVVEARSLIFSAPLYIVQQRISPQEITSGCKINYNYRETITNSQENEGESPVIFMKYTFREKILHIITIVIFI